VLFILFFWGRKEEVGFMIVSTGMKCIVLELNEKEKGKDALNRCLRKDLLFGNKIPNRMQEGWKGKAVIREMMWMMEEEAVKETLIMSYSYGISIDDVPSFNYGLGMCLHVK
jgi:hypothetical protein